VVTAPKHTKNAQELADKIATELRKKFTLKDWYGAVGVRSLRSRFWTADPGSIRVSGLLPLLPQIRHDWFGSVAFSGCVASPPCQLFFGNSGHDAATTASDADMHALPTYCWDALHQMRRTDEAGPHRTAEPEFRSADLPVRAVRHWRMLPEGDV